MRLKPVALFIPILLSLVSCTEPADHFEFGKITLSRMKNQQWKELYECRRAEFKKKYDYETYATSMTNSYKKHGLKSYKIKKVRVMREKYVGIKFEHSVALGNNTITLEDEMIFIDDEEKMICIDTGISNFYPLNAQMVFNKK